MFNLLYKSLIRPHLEYASEVWSPSFKMDINSLEKVQRRATRLVPEIAELPYEERLHHLQLPTLQYRRLRSDLILIFKLTHNMLSLNMLTYCSVCKAGSSMLTPSNSQITRGHIHKYQIHKHTGHRNRFLTTRCIPTWNRLHSATVSSTTVKLFESQLGEDLSMPNKFKIEKNLTSTVLNNEDLQLTLWTRII